MIVRRVASFLLPATALAMVGGALLLSSSSPEAAVRRNSLRTGVDVADPLPAGAGANQITDLAMPTEPPSSVQVLVNRLVILGATADQARLVAETTLVNADGARMLLDGLGLGYVEREKAHDLLVAFLDGRPVTLVGLEPSADLLARIDPMIGAGLDPDAAAWYALREQQEGTLAPAADSGMHVNALDSGDTQQVDRPELGGGAQTMAYCRACPSYDFGMAEPTTTYRTHSGTLTSGADCKLYRFPVRTGRTYRFTFCQGGGTATFDTLLDASSASCEGVAANDDFCGTRSQLDITNQGSSYLFLKVSDKMARGGSYTLAFADITGSSNSGCPTCPSFDYGTYTPTTVWRTHQGTIAAGGCKIYRFITYVGRTYQFSMCQGGGTATADMALDSYSSNCVARTSNDDTCGVLPEITLTANATAYTYVKVRGTGNYTLAYREGSGGGGGGGGSCPTCPAAVTDGPWTPTTTAQTVPLNNVDTSSCRVHQFSLVQGRTYRFSFCQDGGSASFDSILSLLDSACNPVPLAANDDACTTKSEIVYTAGYTGNHYLRVTSKAGAGTYMLGYIQLATVCADPSVPTIAPDPTLAYQSVTGTIASGQSATYKMNVTAGAWYRVTFCAAEYASAVAPFDTVLTVQAPATACSTIVTNNDFCGDDAQVQFQAPAGATSVTITAAGASSAHFGNFTFGYKRLNVTSCTPAGGDTDYDATFAEPGNNSWNQAPADSVAQGAWRTYRFAISALAGGHMDFTTSAASCGGGGGAPNGSAAFNATLRAYRGDTCALIAESTAGCNGEPLVSVDRTGASYGFVYIQIIGDDPNANFGNFTLAYRRQ